jgi:diguanylate cyclase (GGDEF)-like protein
MYQFDNERHLKIGEIVITVKFISLIFFGIAIFIEIPKLFGSDAGILNKLTTTELIQASMIFVIFGLSILLIQFYQSRYINLKFNSRNKLIYDVFEIFIFLLLDTLLFLFSGLYDSPYKIIFLFIMLTVTIQHGVRYGLIVATVSSVIILSIDIITAPVKPNPYLQIDLILCGIFIMMTWLVGYYRNIEVQYSNKMANLAVVDDLTGLYTHGYFQQYLSREIDNSEKTGKPLSLLFLDIDYFKYFNELYGHQAGDEVLKEISVKVKSHVTLPHIAARYGGDEITVLMPETTEQEATHIAENIRKEIETEFADKFAEIKKITVSIGVSCLPTSAKDKNELIKCADDALYRAKSFHKNRVETYQSVLEELKNDLDENDADIISSIKTLISIINTKDKYTYRHVERVVVYSGLIADELDLNEDDKKILKYSAYLHDIGKINISENILNKKMPLTQEEWDILKKHPDDGVDIIKPVDSLSGTLPVILYHHEKYGGGGYPQNLAGDEIPFLARILTVADCFDAMTSNRPYSLAKTFDEAIQELKDCSSTQFDPEIVKVFIKVLKKKKNIF